MSIPLRIGTYRIYCKKEYHDIYKKLKGTVFNEFHELFTLCVILGYKYKKRIEVKRSKEQLFSSDVFTPKEKSAFNTMFILESKEENYFLLKDGEKAREFIQDYADGGMEIFLKADVMKRFVVEKEGKVTLEFGPGDHISKQVMYYVFDLYKEISKDKNTA